MHWNIARLPLPFMDEHTHSSVEIPCTSNAASLVSNTPPTRDWATDADVVQWTRRFREADTRNAVLLDEIDQWDRKFNPWSRPEGVSTSQSTESVFLLLVWPLAHLALNGTGLDRRGVHHIPGLARRLVEAIHQYQTRSGDVLHDCMGHISKLAGRTGAESLAGYLSIADFAERCLADPEDPGIQTTRDELSAMGVALGS